MTDITGRCKNIRKALAMGPTPGPWAACCTLDKAVEQGKLDLDKAELQRDNLEAAVSWNYRIGLVSVSSGRFIDEEVLSNV